MRCVEHAHRVTTHSRRFVISVSVLALNRQNAELDHDIASVPSQHACEPLDCEIEHLASILASLTWHRRQQEARQ